MFRSLHRIYSRYIDQRVIFVLLALITLTPIFCTLLSEIFVDKCRLFPQGDEAILELFVRDVARGEQWLGPYSRFGWNHPGPLYFYLLLPLYLLAGHTTSSLYLTAGIINLFCASGIVILIAQLTQSVFRRVALLGLFALLLSLISKQALQATADSFTAIWNPLVTLLPLTMLCLFCAKLLRGSLRELPLLVGIHAFLVQTHLGLAIPASSMILGALVLRRWCSQPAVTPSINSNRRAWIYASLVGFVVWAPPLLEEFFGEKGNLSAILLFLRKTPSEHALSTALTHSLSSVSALFTQAVNTLTMARIPSSLTLGIAWTLILTVFSMGLCFFIVERTPRYAFALLCLAELALTPFVVHHVRGPILNYLLFWTTVIGFSGVCAVVLAAPSFSLNYLNGVLKKSTTILIALGIVYLSIQTSFRDWTTLQQEIPHRRNRSRVIEESVTAIAPWLSDRSREIEFVVGEHALWGETAGILLQLDKRDLTPRLHPAWNHLYGSRFRHQPLVNETLILGRSEKHNANRVWSGISTSLYHRRNNPKLATHHLALVSTSGLDSCSDTLIDGVFAPEGASWKESRAVTFWNQDAFVIVRLLGAQAVGVRVSADHNDRYRIEGSLDGERFTSLGDIAPASGGGLRTRDLYFSDDSPWRYFRVSPQEGDGWYSVSEIAMIVEETPIVPVTLTLMDQPQTRIMLASTALLDGITVRTDGQNDVLLEASSDGLTYSLTKQLVASGKDGNQTHVIASNDSSMGSFFRFRSPYNHRNVSESELEPIPTLVHAFDLGSPTARSHLLSGWSGDEYSADGFNWIWATSQQAQFTVDLDLGVPYSMTIRARHMPNPQTSQTMEVILNGASIGSCVLTDEFTSHRFTLPLELVRDTNHLVFQFAYAVSPTGDTPSHDARALAAQVDWISFQRLSF